MYNHEKWHVGKVLNTWTMGGARKPRKVMTPAEIYQLLKSNPATYCKLRY